MRDSYIGLSKYYTPFEMKNKKRPFAGAICMMSATRLAMFAQGCPPSVLVTSGLYLLLSKQGVLEQHRPGTYVQ